MREQKTPEKKIKLFEKWRTVAVALSIYDMAAAAGAYFLALWLRFDCSFSGIPDNYLNAWLYFAPLYAVITVAVFWKLRLYQSIWRFASFVELERIALSILILGVSHTVLITLILQRMPITYYAFGIAIQFFLTVLVRFAYRFVLLERGKRAKAEGNPLAGRVMLIGAGAAGQMLLRDLHRSGANGDRVLCIIDDDENKWGRFIDGVPIVGGRDEILLNAKKYKIEKIFLVIPSATPDQRRDILNICKETGCELKNLPSSYCMVPDNITAGSVVDVDVEDLLGRATVKVDMEEIYNSLAGKVILVTGGGGSIGSELCRQIARANPSKLVIFDIYENNAYAIQQELKHDYPDLNFETLIGSVRNTNRINTVMCTYRPDIVFHAAAHKHVPLMEDSPNEAIKNNVIGTYKTAVAAAKCNVKKFVLISTDKAVNPTNIMGASKRLCEMVVQMMDRQSAHTSFVAVRFGNVLGSNGSVIPLFKKQIAEGGPVTVTDKRIIRYFMTIPEAVSLVLQASYYARGGEIFVLDMGEPVKIDDMARNLIRLSGYEPDVDIKVEYTGLRPGEKLYEELLMKEEGLQSTDNHLIHIGKPIEMDDELFKEQLARLDKAYRAEVTYMKELVAEIVPTYHPNAKV